ncbi:hypothetical protein [Geomonas sp.]|uniref:hypothetical protein n=1 Tax=Geomonas sp. TaxID=2651584 RepID=UPI002B47FED6|nr:hypothetical protein [Geomonas sp.]HJV34817.1 hypothetical protein [Geomonas sp.]
MRRKLFAALAITLLLIVCGCGGGGSSPPVFFTTQILSSHANDGDIELDSGGVFHVSQGGLASVFAGLDSVTGSEFRAFLDFRLTGAGGVPGSAFIDSATLDIFIDSYQSTAPSIPVRIELVSFPPQTLLPSDYDRVVQPPLAAIRTFIIPGDVNHNVQIDVTPLMVQAQRLALPDFQVRILEDLGPVTPGLFEIEEATASRAPLLQVIYH